MGGNTLFRAFGHAGHETPAREARDFYPTPPGPLEALMRVERGMLDAAPLIWEPCCGDGALVRPLRAAGYRVVASDVIDRGCEGAEVADFLQVDAPPEPGAVLLTNPPFGECNTVGKFRFIAHAHRIGVERMALLLPVHWACPSAAGEWWERWRPARVWQITWRIDFTGKGAPPSYHAWYVWDGRDRTGTLVDRLSRASGAGMIP